MYAFSSVHTKRIEAQICISCIRGSFTFQCLSNNMIHMQIRNLKISELRIKLKKIQKKDKNRENKIKNVF